MQTEADIRGPSIKMMAQAVTIFHEHMTAEHLQEEAARITQGLLDFGIVRLEARDYINKCAENGIQCILSTGSYADGLYSFMDHLYKK